MNPKDRTLQPPSVLPERLTLPEDKLSVLANGIKIWTLKAGTQDVIRLTLVFAAGTRRQIRPFIASATLNMLSEGTEKYSSAEIAERLDFYGIYYDTSIDRDYAMITISCLNRFLPQALELLEQVVLYPSFLPRELEIYRAKRKQQLKIERKKPSYIARELFAESLFGKDHPYGKVSSEEEYDGLTVEMLLDFYRNFFGADNLFAVATGMINDRNEAEIKDFLSKIKPYGVPTDNPPIKPESVTYAYRKREGAMQSSVRVGKLLFPKGHPDYNGMLVLAMVLGGYFGSRLVKNLREEHGYTYGIYAAILSMQFEGYIAIATDVADEFAAAAINEIFNEIRKLRTELVPIKELDMVRNMIAGEMMRILDGPFGIADVTIENIQSGDDNSYINRFLQEVRSITPERLQELALKYLDLETFTTVVVGGGGMDKWRLAKGYE